MGKIKKEKDEEMSDLYEFLAYFRDDVENFMKAPRIAQEIYFMGVDMTDLPAEYSYYNLEPPMLPFDLTPIETILSIAYQVYTLHKTKNTQHLESQYDVYLENEKHYIIDFYDKETNLAIECDGHEFHQKTKEQVAHDNERELDLKMAGYNIIRFSGSQIYNKPFECARDIYEYIQKLKEEKSNELH